MPDLSRTSKHLRPPAAPEPERTPTPTPTEAPTHEPGAASNTGPPGRFRAAADVMSDPPPVAVIAGVAWRQCVTVLVSESSAGKTFVLLDMAGAVNAGVARTTLMRPKLNRSISGLPCETLPPGGRFNRIPGGAG
jgi:hypothetical protein